MRLEKILVPTDFSDTADHATAQAVELAANARSSARAVSCRPALRRASAEHDGSSSGTMSPRQSATPSRPSPRNPKRSERRSMSDTPPHTKCRRSKRSRARSRAFRSGPGRHGNSWPARLRAFHARKHRRENPARRARRRAHPQPRSASRWQRDPGFTRILVPVDFSEFSQRALEKAFSLLSDDGKVVRRARGRESDLPNVLPRPRRPAGPGRPRAARQDSSPSRPSGSVRPKSRAHDPRGRRIPRDPRPRRTGRSRPHRHGHSWVARPQPRTPGERDREGGATSDHTGSDGALSAGLRRARAPPARRLTGSPSSTFPALSRQHFLVLTTFPADEPNLDLLVHGFRNAAEHRERMPP